MHTQTHVIMGAALLGRKVPALAWAGALGGLIPDVPMYAIVLTLKVIGVPAFFIFNVLYFQNWWQIANAIGHSLIMWPLLAILCWLLRQRTSERVQFWLTFIAVLASSATLHSVVDFLCHREDAHMHFWPLTWWKFTSPISYWNPLYFGRYVSVAEAVTGIAMAVYLFRTYANKFTRILLALAVFCYVAVPAYFIYLN
jgi:LexA-binding, inner membrane-associated putative hydrolase